MFLSFIMYFCFCAATPGFSAENGFLSMIYGQLQKAMPDSFLQQKKIELAANEDGRMLLALTPTDNALRMHLIPKNPQQDGWDLAHMTRRALLILIQEKGLEEAVPIIQEYGGWAYPGENPENIVSMYRSKTTAVLEAEAQSS